MPLSLLVVLEKSARETKSFRASEVTDSDYSSGAPPQVIQSTAYSTSTVLYQLAHGGSRRHKRTAYCPFLNRLRRPWAWALGALSRHRKPHSRSPNWNPNKPFPRSSSSPARRSSRRRPTKHRPAGPAAMRATTNGMFLARSSVVVNVPVVLSGSGSTAPSGMCSSASVAKS